MRRVVIGLIGASMLVAASMGSALAKEGDVEAILTPLEPPHAGQPTTFSARLTRPDGTPVAGETVTFVLARVADTKVVRVGATEQPGGWYVASITLPSSGSWVISVRALDQGGMGRTFPLGSLHVQPALPTATHSTTTSTLMVPAWALALTLILGAALALGGSLGIGMIRRRRLTPDQRQSVPAPAEPSPQGVGVTGATERTQA
jgi:hypothetical protein